MRPTATANRKSNNPMKLTMSASWLRRRPKPNEMNFCNNPISAVQIAKKKITKPPKVCHGLYAALEYDSARGNTKEKKPIKN